MSRLLFISIFCFLLIEISYAQKETITPKISKTNSFEDSLSKVFVDRISIKYPDLIWDYEHIFTEKQRVELDSIITEFEKETSNEILIVTIDSSWTKKENFNNLIIAIHNGFGVGEKHNNNGIVIGISATLRMIRISNGYGIEAKLTDEETKKIIDDIIIPEFKKGNYFEGTKKGLITIMKKIL